MTKNRTSMADIAAHAGVSTATVSRVFNGVGQVSADTRRKVLTAMTSWDTTDRPLSAPRHADDWHYRPRTNKPDLRFLHPPPPGGGVASRRHLTHSDPNTGCHLRIRPTFLPSSTIV